MDFSWSSHLALHVENNRSVEPKVGGALTYRVGTAMTLGQDHRAQGDNREDPGKGTDRRKTQGRRKESWEQSKSSKSHTVDSRESLEKGFPQKLVSSAAQSPVRFHVPLLEKRRAHGVSGLSWATESRYILPLHSVHNSFSHPFPGL